jgi:hypothetical protein
MKVIGFNKSNQTHTQTTKAPFCRAISTAFCTAGITAGPPGTNNTLFGSRKSFCDNNLTRKMQNISKDFEL